MKSSFANSWQRPLSITSMTDRSGRSSGSSTETTPVDQQTSVARHRTADHHSPFLYLELPALASPSSSIPGPAPFQRPQSMKSAGIHSTTRCRSSRQYRWLASRRIMLPRSQLAREHSSKKTRKATKRTNVPRSPFDRHLRPVASSSLRADSVPNFPSAPVLRAQACAHSGFSNYTHAT